VHAILCVHPIGWVEEKQLFIFLPWPSKVFFLRHTRRNLKGDAEEKRTTACGVGEKGREQVVKLCGDGGKREEKVSGARH